MRDILLGMWGLFERVCQCVCVYTYVHRKLPTTGNMSHDVILQGVNYLALYFVRDIVLSLCKLKAQTQVLWDYCQLIVH